MLQPNGGIDKSFQKIKTLPFTEARISAAFFSWSGPSEANVAMEPLRPQRTLAPHPRHHHVRDGQPISAVLCVERLSAMTWISLARGRRGCQVSAESRPLLTLNCRAKQQAPLREPRAGTRPK
jgi:hypothetical protein